MRLLSSLRWSFGRKLLAAQLLVVIAGSLTLLAVALSVGPIFFHRHVREALGVVPPDVARHLDMAFSQSTLLALGIAAAAAAATAFAVSWFVSARVTRALASLAAASSELARGAYDTRVPVVAEDEIGALARSFNQMAAVLEQTEQRRRALLSDVAHELRTPLATIGAYAEAASDGVMRPDSRVWAVIRNEIARLTRLADDLQKVSRAEERQLDLRIVPIAPGMLVESAVAAAAATFETKHVRIAAHVDRALRPVLGDADRLGEVIANLLDNALRHTPPGGSVTVAASGHADQIEIAVSDTGEGIAQVHLPRIFERFYRVEPARDRASGGSGIGLAIAKAIAEAHGGTISAESAGPGRGATFRLRLPSA